MIVTLFEPGQLPRRISSVGKTLPNAEGFAQVTDTVARELGCVLKLVDVLDCGPDYAAYSIFDYEGQPNPVASDALRQVSKHSELYTPENEELQGPILLVTRA